MFNEPKTIPEDLMLELEESIKKCQIMAEENLEKCLHLFGKVKAINERHQDEEWREWEKDYEESVRC